MNKTLRERLKELEEFEELILGKREARIEELSDVELLDNPKETVLYFIRSLKGLILLFSKLPDIPGKEKIQAEIEEITSGFDSFILKKEEESGLILGIPKKSKGIHILYTIEDGTTIATISVHFKKLFPSILRVLGIKGLIEEFLLSNSTRILTLIEDYTNKLENKHRKLQKLKEELEEFIKENILEVFSKNFLKQASELQKQAGRFAIVTAILYTTAFLFLLCILINPSSGLQSVMARFTIVFLIAGIATYLLKYTIRLFERKNEYENKALVLSTFPALNYFLGSDEHKFELIRTLILENQKLQTLQSEKHSSINEDLILKLFSILKDVKPGGK